MSTTEPQRTGAPAPPDLAVRLADVVADGVAADAAARRALAIGGVVPGLVCTPADHEQLARAVAATAAAGAALVPLGLGAHRTLGHAPARYDVALVTRRLDRIRDYTPADMTITVEAGVPVAALQHLLATEGQWLPLEPPLPARTTVGGLIAADLVGAPVAAQGRVRDFVIGIGAVTAAGRPVRAGGKVVKNVAGYDLMKLVTGSLGTLAVVSEATFKVRPRPATLRTLVVDAGGAPAALALAEQIAIGRVDPLAATVLLDLDGGVRRARLLVRLAGIAADVGVAERRLATLARAAGATVQVVQDRDPSARLLVEEVRDLVRTGFDGDLVVRLAVLPRRAAACAAALVAGAGSERARLHVDVGAGRLTLAVTAAAPAGALAALAGVATAHAGHLVVERWPDALAATIEVWCPLPAALPLMRRMKAALDPRGTLAPGRFVGRI